MKQRPLAASEAHDLFKQGRWNTALIQTALEQANNSQDAADWITYLDICQSIQGITAQEWLHVTEQYNAGLARSPKLLLRLLYLIKTPGIIENLSESDRHRYTNVLNRSQIFQMFATLTDIKTSGYLGCRLSHYPGLLQRVVDDRNMRAHSQTRCVKFKSKANLLAEKIVPFHELEKQLLPERATVGRSRAIIIAVVGNSPTILNSEQGSAIDAADLIIRFNNASVSQNKIQYTGKRTDIWVMSPSTSINHCPADARAVIVSGLNSLTRPSFYWKKLVNLDRPLSEFPSHIWYQLTGLFNAPPSAGTLLLASLEEQADNAEIRCYGFSTNQTDRHQLSNHHTDSRPRSNRHNWKAEIEWLAHQPTQRKAFVITGQ